MGRIIPNPPRALFGQQIGHQVFQFGHVHFQHDLYVALAQAGALARRPAQRADMAGAARYLGALKDILEKPALLLV